VKTIRVDGNDVLAVYAATERARAIALAENCPVLIEAMTYRLAAHSTSDDPTGYRSREEEDKWRAKDPVLRLAKWMEGKGWLDTSGDSELVEKLRQEVLAELKVAEKVPVCRIEEIVEDVYDTPPWHLQEQLQQLKSHIALYPEAYPKTAGRVTNG
jgi:2-oxoisovalerate dehydrogenase E1 component alpha subunit